MQIEDRLNHIGELVRGLSEQNSGNMTILNSNCKMLANRLEALEERVQELEDFNTPAEQKLELLRNQIDRVDKNFQELESRVKENELLRVAISDNTGSIVELEKKLKDLETKTASELSQEVVVESATGEEQDCLWLARSKSGRLYSFTEKPQISSNGEHWNGRNILFWGTSKYKALTYENSPQKLVLESAISKNETVGDGYVPTIDDFFYNRDEENSEKPNNQEFDKERALELLQDIESSSTKNSNASTKAILLSCAELREMLGGE